MIIDNGRPTLYIMAGIPGSGKSTIAKEVIKKYSNLSSPILHISRDKIRFELVKEDEPYFSKENEVYRSFISLISSALSKGISVIADATNINKKSRKKLIDAIDKISLSNQYNIIIIFLNVHPDVCEFYNDKRNGRERVPTEAIWRMAYQKDTPSLDEDGRIKAIIQLIEEDIFGEY